MPQSIPVTSAKSHTQKAVAGVVGTDKATITEPIAPIRYCPGAPMLKSPVLKAIATERPVRSKGADSKNISPSTKEMFLIPPLAKGPARMMKRPLKASEVGILSEVRARIKRTIQPTKIPATMQSKEEITDFIPSEAITDLSLFFILLSSFLAFGTGHVKTQLLNRGLLGVKLSNDLALIHHENSVREAHDLIQLKRNEKHRRAAVSGSHYLIMDVFDCADVESACGLDGHKQLVVPVHFSCNDGLLLVSARHGARNRNGALTGTNVKPPDQVLGVFAYCRKADKSVFLKSGLKVSLENHILLKGILSTSPCLCRSSGMWLIPCVLR